MTPYEQDQVNYIKINTENYFLQLNWLILYRIDKYKYEKNLQYVMGDKIASITINAHKDLANYNSEKHE